MIEWMTDARQILTVKIDGVEYSSLAGSWFERFERNGEYCMIPWIRIVGGVFNEGQTIEAPAHKVDKIVYAGGMR